MESETLSQDSGNFLVRLFYILVYLVILGVVRFVLWGILLIQLLYHLVGAPPNASAQRAGQRVAGYIYQVWLYLTYSSDSKPFPFRPRKPS
jgi:hypothetical protein